jgi:hypothetical protein
VVAQELKFIGLEYPNVTSVKGLASAEEGYISVCGGD